jgi:FlaA1/EpsC-like NDP-sugar epimerase
MKKVFRIIKDVLMWVVIIGAFSALGFGSDNPLRAALFWAGLAVLIFAIGFVIAKHAKRRTVSTQREIIFRKVFGVILVVFACILPNLVLGGAGFPFWIYLLIFVFAAALIALGSLAVTFINKHLQGKKNMWSSVLGYLILVIGALLPGLIMSTYDSSYGTLATVYYLLVALAIFSWIGISMFTKQKSE